MTDQPSPPEEEGDWLFDFFEEGETHENVSASDAAPDAGGGKPPRGPRRRGPSSQGRARARLLALVVLVILLIATGIIVAVGNGSEAGPDSAYLTKVAVPAQDSQAVGVALNRLLSKTPTSASAFESSLRQLVSRQEKDLSETAAITPPPRLRAEHQQAVSAMQFRVGGLKGLAIGFKDALANPKETDWNTQLSLQADGLITSDVIWRNYFVTPVNAQVVRDGDTTGTAPASIFISNANVTAPAAMATMLAALSGHPKTTTTTVQLGSHGSAVTAWQTQLNQWIATQSGMSKVNVSGTFDQATQTATEAFQTAANITVDGVVGPATRAAMASALAQKGG